MLNTGIVLERDTIYDRIWGFDFETELADRSTCTSATCAARPRPSGEPRLVHTVRGVGYVVRERP